MKTWTESTDSVNALHNKIMNAKQALGLMPHGWYKSKTRVDALGFRNSRTTELMLLVLKLNTVG